MAFLSRPRLNVSTRRSRSSSIHFRRALVLFCMLLSTGNFSPIWSQSEGPTEYQVKAAFVYNFAKFVEWPAEAFNGNNGPMRFCILGESLVGPDLSRITQGKAIAGHPIQVVLNSRNLRDCHILFVSSSHSVPVKDIRENLSGAAVLTIGETRDFAEQGGVIGFVIEDARVRFEINLQRAKQLRLIISSKLLSLAKRIIT